MVNTPSNSGFSNVMLVFALVDFKTDKLGTNTIFMHSFLNSFSHGVSCCVIAIHFSPLLVFRNGEMEQHLVYGMLLPLEDGAR